MNFFNSLLKDLSSDYNFRNSFPRLSNYENKKLLQLQFPSLSVLNSSEFDPFQYADYEMLLIECDSMDDLHKSIKYGVVTFEERENEELSRVYQ